jgi:hypothetical protein
MRPGTDYTWHRRRGDEARNRLYLARRREVSPGTGYT